MPLGPEKSIFLHALDVDSPSERDAFVEEACQGDPGLRAAVFELLREHQREENPLDRPIAVLSSALVDETIDRQPFGALGSTESPGTLIGPYKLMEQIGEGGFGLVFVAEQQQPVRRRVALKIIKPGMETRDVIARFEAERQALALMDHANIARVFDAGVTRAGRPFFVMELVRGVPVTDFCDNHQLDTLRRLDLFISICNAIQHAHQKGIIHRDIKPTNVLVTLQDGKPLAKVIDFGVAKAIGQSLTDKTIYTRFTSMIGTPTYMSPEQAEMSNIDIDTRSDIYSLGILLYELLTGSTPFSRDRLDGVGFDELRRIIREEEPPRPSTRISTLELAVSTTISSNRRLEPPKLAALVKGDLDWIVMKAIDKDRNRRYATSSALAEDVQRFLAGQPIHARPSSTAYRLVKFARRNKVTITTVSLIVATLILGSVISAWQALRAVRERDEKMNALNKAVAARNEASAARDELSQFADRLKEANALFTSGRAHADAGRRADANSDYTQATELQPNYFHVWVERGSMYLRLGLWKRAAADFAKALELGAPSDGPEWWGVPQLLWYTGDRPNYIALCEAMVQSQSSSERPVEISIRGCLFGDLRNVTSSQLAEQAETLLDRSREASRQRGSVSSREDRRRSDGPRLTGRNPPRNRRDEPLGASLYVAGWAQYRAGDFQKAIDRLEESHTLDSHWPGHGISYPLLAMSYHRTGRLEESLASFNQAEAAMNEWLDETLKEPNGSPPIPWFDWIEFLTHFRDACMLVKGYAPPDDLRLGEIESRAESMIEHD